jgi:hypothetical protein
MRAFLLFLLPTLAAGCAAVQRPHVTVRAPDPQEEALLARFPQSVRREGNVLLVAARGGMIRYEDKDCEQDSDCAVFRLVDVFLDGRLFGIEVGYYEGGDYIVADTHSQHLFTGEKPSFSPNGRLFATAAFNEAYETAAEGVRLWSLEGGLRSVRAISPDILSYPEGLTWRGDRCVEFTAVEGSLYDDEGGERPRPTRYLVEAAPEWRLTADRDPLCRN